MYPFLGLLPRCPAYPQQGAGLRPGYIVHFLCTPILDILFSRDQIPNTLTPKPQEAENWICSSFSSSISRNFLIYFHLLKDQLLQFSLSPLRTFFQTEKATRIRICWALMISSASKLKPNSNKPLVNVWFQNSRTWGSMWPLWAQTWRNQTQTVQSQL